MKNRTEIPKEIVAQVLFESDRTCCVCRIPGKPVQLHHIDQDPCNHDPANLAVLCLECHNETQITGGFSRKLDATQVRTYRDDWHPRVAQRRNLADQHAVLTTIVPSPPSATTLLTQAVQPIQHEAERSANHSDLIDYIRSLPKVLGHAYGDAQPHWDRGMRSEMIQANYDVIDVLERILIHLARWYPPNHFGGQPAELYMNSITASRFEWHRAHLEPKGTGTGGGIINIICAGKVMDDLESMVEDMVGSFTIDSHDLDFPAWRERWRRHGA